MTRKRWIINLKKVKWGISRNEKLFQKDVRGGPTIVIFAEAFTYMPAKG